MTRHAAKQLGVDFATMDFIVEGWFRVAARILADGHTVPTMLGTFKTKRADARLRRSHGYRRDLKLVISQEARALLDRTNPALRDFWARSGSEESLP